MLFCIPHMAMRQHEYHCNIGSTVQARAAGSSLRLGFDGQTFVLLTALAGFIPRRKSLLVPPDPLGKSFGT